MTIASVTKAVGAKTEAIAIGCLAGAFSIISGALLIMFGVFALINVAVNNKPSKGFRNTLAQLAVSSLSLWTRLSLVIYHHYYIIKWSGCYSCCNCGCYVHFSFYRWRIYDCICCRQGEFQST